MIKEIEIRNFKSIHSVKITCNNTFNVIIGKNNVGKTTIFEAIHLWKMCYDAQINKKKKSFRTDANSQNIPFKDMEFLRISTDMDLFCEGCKPKDAELLVKLCVEYDSELFDLGFLISKVQKIDNAYFQVKYENYSAFQRFATKLLSKSYNLVNGIVISESRPIANIIVKEPYMYKDQVLEKISKGKGYDVLRNKIIKTPAHIEKVAEHLKNIMDRDYKINVVDEDNKTYIRLSVNGTNILSQGSGFLQIAEIFSSLEYSDAAIYILLIDEPDSHLHFKLQHKLIEEFRNINNSQLFIITHNDKFLNEVKDSEILFVNEKDKNLGIINPLKEGGKNLVLYDLAGALESLDTLRFVRKIVLLEGKTDEKFFENMLPLYLNYTGKEHPNIYMDKLNGIDSLRDKLLTFSNAFMDLVPNDAEWIVIRDTDCIPISKQDEVKNYNLFYLQATNKKEIFQNGYGIESTFISEIDKFAGLLIKYYSLSNAEISNIKLIIDRLNNDYATKVVTATNDIYKELLEHFERQKKSRKEKIYETLRYSDILDEINGSNIQYIMTKKILNMYLKDLNDNINSTYSLSKVALDSESIMTFYYDTITSLDDLLLSHISLLEILF